MISTNSKAFCAGADVREISECKYEKVMNDDFMDEFRETIGRFSKPLVIAVNGYVLGGGFELALSADILICTSDTKFALPEIKLGIIPGIGGT